MKVRLLAAAALAFGLLACGGGDSETTASNAPQRPTGVTPEPPADAPEPPIDTPEPPVVRPEPVHILFVGNSFTFGRVAPVLQYNTANVADLTQEFNDVSPATNSNPVGSGIEPTPCATTTATTGCFEVKPWGGVPGIFKALTEQAGLSYVVSLSTRNAATLRGHFLNTGDARWDLRGNIAKQKWDVVVVQGQSDEPLPRAKSKNGNPASFSTYANVIAEYVHTGSGGTTTEAAIFGSLANCTAAVTATPPGPGLSAGSCNTNREIPANAFANPQAKVYLTQTWARPDMVEPHKCITIDQTTLDGRPRVDPTCDQGGNGSAVTGQNTVFYTTRASTPANLQDMTTDMQSAFASLAAMRRPTGESRFAGILPVGNAFQRAVNTGVVKGSAFYKADGTYDDSGTLMNLWWLDSLHGSKYGSYLSALVQFGSITGLDPARFGATEFAAADLGISGLEAVALQRVASETLATTFAARAGDLR